MLDKEYQNNLNHFLDVLLYTEENVICIRILEKIDRTKFNNYFHIETIIKDFERCLIYSRNVDCISLYMKLISGIKIELEVGKTLN